MYGFDVAIKRADDLDRQMLKDIIASPKPVRILDLGAGAGGQSSRLVRAGAYVRAIDVYPYQPEFTKLRQELGVGEIELQFSCGDILDLVPRLPELHYHHVCLQRTLHYLTYHDATVLLCELAKKVSGRLYISVTGSSSAIGLVHPLRTQSIEKRFAILPPEAADTFYIYAPFCVYTQSDLINLLDESGWKIEKIWESTFGNIKAIARLDNTFSPH